MELVGRLLDSVQKMHVGGFNWLHYFSSTLRLCIHAINAKLNDQNDGNAKWQQNDLILTFSLILNRIFISNISQLLVVTEQIGFYFCSNYINKIKNRNQTQLAVDRDIFRHETCKQTFNRVNIHLINGFGQIDFYFKLKAKDQCMYIKLARLAIGVKFQLTKFYNYNTKQMDSLCKACHKFYGAPQKQFYCSVCYKQICNNKKIEQQIKLVAIPQPPAPPKQTDHSKCFTCHKKIGLLGFKCKECDCSYCKLHRLPEDHHCKIDFVQMGKKQMEKNKTVIMAPKVEQI